MAEQKKTKQNKPRFQKKKLIKFAKMAKMVG